MKRGKTRWVAGIAVNNSTYGLRPAEEIIEQLRVAAGLCARNNWHVQLFTPANTITHFRQPFQKLDIWISSLFTEG